MSGEAKKYRRTKRVVQHANPLFDSWLLEWQQDSEKRGSNMKYNFQRARKSLSLYPLPLYTGQDCKLLANFGNKICQMLDKRLAQHEEEFGATDWAEIHKIKETPRKAVRKKPRATTAAVPTASTANTERRRRPQAPRSPREPGNEDSQRRKRTKSKSPYIPLVRSGAYAMLMTLHQASLDAHYKGFMKKEELIEAAQPLCDASLLKPDKVGSYYSAWSSMATLVKKGLVLRYSHPPKFNITEAGKALAIKLEGAERSIDVLEDAHPPSTASIDVGRADELSSNHLIPTHTLSSSDDDNEGEDGDGVKDGSCSPASSTLDLTQSPQLGEEEEEESNVQEEAVSFGSASRKDHPLPGHHSPLDSSASPPGGLRFSYVTPLDMETPLKDSAGVTVEEDGFLGFLIKCGASDLQESGLHYRLDHTRTARAGLVYAYLSNECAPDQCTGLNQAAAAPPPTPPPPSPSPKQRKAKLRRNGLSHQSSGSKVAVAPPHKTRTAQPHTEANIEPFTVAPPAPACTAAVTPASSYVPFTLLPENYEIILCVDIAETSGKSAEAKPSIKDTILSELKRNGVKYSIRKLHVGDYLWVCQETRPSLATSRGTSTKQDIRELVLPVVVERKRMDDLASSIKDGRFKEQKFRLQQCGLSHPVYLVEEHRGSVSAGLSMPETNCLQAIVNTQVINGFTVKVVKGQRESAAYLTIMTRYLQSKYQNKIVRSAQLQDLDGNQTNHLPQTETSMLSFSEFNAASMKNQQLTVREMFAKHLMQLYGVSADKARAVVDKYGTPSLLMAAYKEETTSEGAKKLLAGLKWGKAGRSLGPVLSANIANLYTAAVLQ